MKLSVVSGDITLQQVDAIVNAANTSLLGGGGVDGAIHRAAGPELLAECRGLGGCPTGEARLTKGYNLPANFVIHTVGPIWQGGQAGEADLLAACYRNTLSLAGANGLISLAYPAISTGVYGYPSLEAAKVAIETIQQQAGGKNWDIRFVCFDDMTKSVYQQLLSAWRSGHHQGSLT